MPESPVQLLASLAAWPGVNRYLVAFSGGLDSSVLLHAMARLARDSRGMSVRAVHVHHGLHPEADAWAAHCRETCSSLGLPIDVYHADISVRTGVSHEAEARRARYHILANAMQPNDAVLTAHHADDQLETLLMRLVRGGGVEGLAGIPSCRALGPGRLLRPLLSRPREELADYAQTHGLACLEDPSNSDIRFDRNYLRREILPRLKARWPAASANAVRGAGHLSAAGRLLEDIAAEDLRVARDEHGTLNVPRIRAMTSEHARNLLRYWIRENGYEMPSTAKLAAVLKEVVGAAHDAEPHITWQGAEIRRYRDRLFLMRPLPPAEPGWWQAWNPGEPLMLPSGLGRLLAVAHADGGLAPHLLERGNLTVRFRKGGERIRPAGSGHHRTLRNLCQERGIVPWMRARVPLLYLDDQLAAVADLWIAEEFAAAGGSPGLRLRWEARPPY